MWDEGSFEARSFEPGSWLCRLSGFITRFVVRLTSSLAMKINLISKV